MLNPELRERLWPFLGGIAKQNGARPFGPLEPPSTPNDLSSLGYAWDLAL
jgi:hypothetical protein